MCASVIDQKALMCVCMRALESLGIKTPGSARMCASVIDQKALMCVCTRALESPGSKLEALGSARVRVSYVITCVYMHAHNRTICRRALEPLGN